MPSKQLIALRSTIQNLIDEGMSKCQKSHPKCDTFVQENSNLTPMEGNDKFLLEDNFKSLLLTFVLFLNQDTYYNVLMNLDFNFCCVLQDNLTEGDGANIKDSILEENRKSFQNSPLCLMLYEELTSKKKC